MTWIEYCWPVATGACLAMGLVHFWIGIRGASRRANLLFALNAVLVATYSCTELRLMNASNPAEYLGRLRWLDLSAGFLTITLLLFVWSYFGTVRKWLGILGIACMGLSLTADLRPVPQLVFREFTGIHLITTFGGATYPVAEGVASPWNALFYLSVLIQLLFVSDASITSWRRGDRGRATVVGGTIVIFYLLGGLQASLVDIGAIKTPYLVTFIWLIILGAMAWALTRNLLQSAQISQELRDTQERMQLATTAVDIGVWEWDIDHDEFWLTDTIRKGLGAGPAERVNFGRFLESLHPDDRKPTERAVRNALATQDEFEVEYRLVTAEGMTRSMATRGRVEHGRKGQALRVRGVSIDITERKRAEAESHRQQVELAHVSRVSTLGQLAASLTHEINQPLGAILRNAEAAELFLQQEPPDYEELRAILADIRNDDQRAGEVIDRMRSLFKRQHLEFAPISLPEILNQTTKLLKAELQARHVTLAVDHQADLPLVRGDRVHLQQVLLNLVMNGLDAMEGRSAGPHRLTVQVRQSDEKTVEVAVTDQGPGIPTDKLAYIFEAFFTTKPKGLGMGLAISRTIIESHGGRIWAENGAEGGATFRFTLKIADAGGEA
jgi:signal transduction histidine kinase